MESVHAPFEKGLMKKGSQEYLVSSLLHLGVPPQLSVKETEC